MCNHTSECADSSDEDHCQRFRSCYSSEFQCDNRQCVRPFAVCDDYQDCADNSDEKECQPSDFVTCKSGKKIHKFWWCNNFPDCSENYHDDDTDELNCTCGEEHFRCHNSRCIFKGNVCDSKCDCQGCEDEVDCRHVYVNDSGVTECLKGKSVECNGRCIAKEFICDGIRHCYGEDLTEFGCCKKEPQGAGRTSNLDDDSLHTTIRTRCLGIRQKRSRNGLAFSSVKI
ncbi:G-protein coupled receptor GRL101-like isoform X2 [Scylla paramamosain]|uniref:G-protein coupled receptor GRL101-like isoform X2 n=1 Tax=Scylla paramamosain TaxID=85552 RepID=UPI003082B0DB